MLGWSVRGAKERERGKRRGRRKEGGERREVGRGKERRGQGREGGGEGSILTGARSVPRTQHAQVPPLPTGPSERELELYLQLSQERQKLKQHHRKQEEPLGCPAPPPGELLGTYSEPLLSP